jgi:hypothetical protein
MTLREAVDNMGMSLKADLLSLFEDDRKMKNIRFQEVFHLIDSNKSLLNEHISQQFESLKALTRAFVNKEVAERTSGDNSILSQVNKRLDGFDAVFESKIKEDIRELAKELKDNMAHLDKAIDDVYKAKDTFEADIKKIVGPSFKAIDITLEAQKRRLDEADVKNLM